MTTTLKGRDSSRGGLPILAPLFRLLPAGTGGFYALIALLILVVATATTFWGAAGLVSVALVLTPTMLAILALIARP